MRPASTMMSNRSRHSKVGWRYCSRPCRSRTTILLHLDRISIRNFRHFSDNKIVFIEIIIFNETNSIFMADFINTFRRRHFGVRTRHPLQVNRPNNQNIRTGHYTYHGCTIFSSISTCTSERWLLRVVEKVDEKRGEHRSDDEKERKWQWQWRRRRKQGSKPENNCTIRNEKFSTNDKIK